MFDVETILTEAPPFLITQIVRNAQEHGVKMLSIDLNLSQWDNTFEATQSEYFAQRLELRAIDGIRKEEMDKLVTGKINPYAASHQLCDAGQCSNDGKTRQC